jgi:putative oxidoreductase
LIEEPLDSWLLLAGRIALATVFLASGIHKGIWYQKAVEEFRRDRIPWISFFLPATIVLHLVAPLCLILGYETRVASLALAAFVTIATLKVHAYWRLPKEARLARSRVFTANVSILGGLLLLAAAGPGRFALMP